VGIVLSGYVELAFDAWVDEEEAEAQARARKAAGGGPYYDGGGGGGGSDRPRKAPRAAPPKGELDGMYFEPHS
jgi:hypothetical protein